MRIAYVSLHWPRTRKTGVGKKIQGQIAAWRSMGHEARLFMHTSSDVPESDLIEADVFPYKTNGRFQTEINRSLAATGMVESVRAFKPDVIYLRYGIYLYPAHRLMDIAPVIEEINTNDVAQHEGLGPIYNYYNRLTRGVFLRLVKGIVPVSRELERAPEFLKYRKPARVVSNGIDLHAYNPLPAPGNSRPRLVFVATPGYYWHGEDKLVLLARKFPDVGIDVVGFNRFEYLDPVPGNLRFHGYLENEAYEKVLSGADAAIGTLALHRKKMEEASPLKTRECLAYGIPMILPYLDTDLGDLDCEFLLKIPNKEDNIQTHGEAIRAFAYRMRGMRADRVMLEKLIDSTDKEVMRLKFFEEILQKGRGDE